MSFHGTIATLAALSLAACSANAPPAEVSQGAVSAVMVAEFEDPAGKPEFQGARTGGDALRSRLND
jgi:hypothetical protein